MKEEDLGGEEKGERNVVVWFGDREKEETRIVVD